MGSFDDIAESPADFAATTTEVFNDFPPEPPAIPRPGVHAVLKYSTEAGWKWELTADRDIRMYWDLKLAGQWPD